MMPSYSEKYLNLVKRNKCLGNFFRLQTTCVEAAAIKDSAV